MGSNSPNPLGTAGEKLLESNLRDGHFGSLGLARQERLLICHRMKTTLADVSELHSLPQLRRGGKTNTIPSHNGLTEMDSRPVPAMRSDMFQMSPCQSPSHYIGPHSPKRRERETDDSATICMNFFEARTSDVIWIIWWD